MGNFGRYRCAWAIAWTMWIFAFFPLLAMQSLHAQSSPVVDRIEIRDTIQPVSATRLERALNLANRDHAAALLVELDTPGGLLDSTREMVGAILSSRVPVIVYIAPAGARAGSAGFFLLESADVAAMAQGTNAGAAHPVLESGTPDTTIKEKMENDAAAFLRSYVSRRGRNAQAAEEGVRASHAWSADEALTLHLIDLTAPDENQLLAALDGRSITRIDGSKLALNLHNAHIVTLPPTVREQVLGYLVNPNLALLLLVGGALLIYVEFNTPGTIVPGALGTVMVLLAAFALNLLPIRHTAILLLLAAAVLLLLEMKFTSHGVLALAGIACLVFGALTLVAAPIPELGIRPAVAVGLSLGFGIITVILLRLAVRARKSKFVIGPAALVGYPATTMEPIGEPGQASGQLFGHILVQGEIWQATASEPVPQNANVQVIGVDGDVLQVQPVSPTTLQPL
ncbi:NfeD family protein [Acidicapsa ligni]|uniref:NfeD family protein n=1 Tax=Acidicapsa ligni TaxID=542300 RepID=UPI0021E0FAAD|nr:nodulation protein NfeD [Acidicapsa ligni]